uniref:Uncharacterized protein n=1 Tax=Romanomermis culicivorax TaxID=13658 RepID=A0A915IM01_ROMCU
MDGYDIVFVRFQPLFNALTKRQYCVKPWRLMIDKRITFDAIFESCDVKDQYVKSVNFFKLAKAQKYINKASTSIFKRKTTSGKWGNIF